MSSLSHHPSNGGHESSESLAPAEELKREKEWSNLLVLLYRESVRVHLKQSSSFPVHKIGPTVVFIYDLEGDLFPIHKLRPSEIRSFEKAIDGHEKALEKLLKSNGNLSQYVSLLRQRLTKLRTHIVKYLI